MKHTICERAVLFLSAPYRLCVLFIYYVAWASRALFSSHGERTASPGVGWGQPSALRRAGRELCSGSLAVALYAAEEVPFCSECAERFFQEWVYCRIC